jgi:hypothetical protein
MIGMKQRNPCGVYPKDPGLFRFKVKSEQDVQDTQDVLRADSGYYRDLCGGNPENPGHAVRV